MNHTLFVSCSSADVLPLMHFFEHKNIKVTISQTIQEALLALEKNPDINFIISDTKLPDGKAIDLTTQCKSLENQVQLYFTDNKLSPSLKKFIDKHYPLTAGFIEKPITISSLENVFANTQTNNHKQHQTTDNCHFGKLVGNSEVMQNLYNSIRRVSPTDASVIITGRSGTGKELIAQAIHDHSARADKPYIAINCGAISPDLMCSALFGHEKGSFTGAVYSHAGYFEQANGGTLFLDEITETPLEFQVKLLRVLETGIVLPVGGKRRIPVDVRIIASTNRCLKEAIKKKVIREDLYYRLSVFPIHAPPLKERGDDVTIIANYFLSHHNQRDNRNIQFSSDAIQTLRNLDFHGNVRELKNIVYRAYILADHTIEPNHIQYEYRAQPSIKKVALALAS